MNLIAKEIATGRLTENVIWEDLGDIPDNKYYTSRFIIDGNVCLSKTNKGGKNINNKRLRNDRDNIKQFGFILGEVSFFNEGI